MKNLRECLNKNNRQISILHRISESSENLEDGNFFSEEVEKRVIEINKKNDLINIAIQQITDLCDHHFKYIGSDGIQVYSKCEHCGLPLITNR